MNQQPAILVQPSTARTAQTQSEAELVLMLARIAQEALQATPQGVDAPPTVSHALALIIERAELMANDMDATRQASGRNS